MNKKTKASLLALTMLVSQQIYCDDEKKPLEAQPNNSVFTLKNAGIAAAVVGTSAAAIAAYYYRDALGDFINSQLALGKDQKTIMSELKSSIKEDNTEMAAKLEDLTAKQKVVAAKEELASLSGDEQLQVITDLIEARADSAASIPVADAVVTNDSMPVANPTPVAQVQQQAADNSSDEVAAE